MNVSHMCFKMGYDLFSLLSPTLQDSILEDFIGWYDFIKGRNLEKDWVIHSLQHNPDFKFKAEICEYGIHGTMVSVTWAHVYWNIFSLEEFKNVIERVS